MSTILVLGEPGTGKSRAIKGLDPKTTVILKPNNKALPFLGWATNYKLNSNMFVLSDIRSLGDTILGPYPKTSDGKSVDRTKQREVAKGINAATHIKTVVVEDFTHYMSKKVVDDSTIKGYDKWTELAVWVYQNMAVLESKLRPDLDVIFICHTQIKETVEGAAEIGMQTSGQMLDRLKLPSYFTYVLHSKVIFADDVPKYVMQTNRDSIRLAKTPEGMFPLDVDNDYGTILARIHAYENGTAEPLVEV